jgi:hypothetical protein
MRHWFLTWKGRKFRRAVLLNRMNFNIMNLKRIESLQFDPGTHSYRDLSYNKALVSVSHILKDLKTEFEEKRMAGFVAKKEGKTLEQVLQEWEIKRRRSTDYGSLMHEAMENAALFNNNYDYENTWKNLRMLMGMDEIGSFLHFRSLMMHVMNRLTQYPVCLPEFRIYDPASGVCGTMDIVCQRTVGRNGGNNVTVDLYDFKTNIENGIQYDSIKRKGLEIVKDYNRRMRFPVEHLEDCNYTHYSLQLSLYAYMIETWFKVHIGRLGIWYINRDFSIWDVPVVYMKSEIMDILKHFSGGGNIVIPGQSGIIDLPYDDEF